MKLYEILNIENITIYLIVNYESYYVKCNNMTVYDINDLINNDFSKASFISYVDVKDTSKYRFVCNFKKFKELKNLKLNNPEEFI